MKLKEIEMDLPYKKNEQYIQQIQKKESLEYEEALRKDYESNWKELRRKFQLMTRCMTAMVERIMIPINTTDCWKIIFECVDDCTDDKYKNLLGVYVVQVPFNYTDFFQASEYDMKKIVINIIIEGINKLSKHITFEVVNIYKACMQIIDNEYVNEWMWGKKLNIKGAIVQIKVKHEINSVRIYMIFSDKCNTILKQVLLIDTIPEEHIYDMYLGKLERISENEVALVTKSEERFIQKCNW